MEKSEFMLLLLVMEFCFKKSKSMDAMEMKHTEDKNSNTLTVYKRCDIANLFVKWEDEQVTFTTFTSGNLMNCADRETKALCMLIGI